MLIPLLIAAAVGYLLGALPFGYLVAKRKGINIFEHGSKNPGATNVKRVLAEKFGPQGKRLGNLVFFLDALKGALATGWPFAWMYYLAATEAQNGHLILAALNKIAVTGLAFALIGHSFCCWTRFKGGKGVATASGGLLVLLPVATLISAVIWAATFYTSRYVSLASILSALALPLAAYLLNQSPLLIGVAAAIALFVVIRHRANIQRLLNGTESKFTKKSPPAPPAA